MKSIKALTIAGTVSLVLSCFVACGDTDDSPVTQAGGANAGGNSGESTGGRGTTTGGSRASGGRSGGTGGTSRGGATQDSGGAAGEVSSAGAAGEEMGGSAGLGGVGGDTGTTPKGGSSGTGTSSGGVSASGGNAAGGKTNVGGSAGSEDLGGAAGFGGAGGAGGAEAQCPMGVPAHKAECAEWVKCEYPNAKCVCSGERGELRWECDITMDRCPPKLPTSGSECKGENNEPMGCEYGGGVICSCSSEGLWQCSPQRVSP